MTKDIQYKIARIVVPFVFLFMLPFKYAVLTVFGTETTGLIQSISSLCTNGKPENPQPKLTIIYFIKGEKKIMQGGISLSNREFCGFHVRDSVKVVYFQAPVLNLFLDTVEDPKSTFFTVFVAGIFFSLMAISIMSLRSNELMRMGGDG